MSTPLFLRYKLLQKYFQEYTYALAYIWYMLAKLLHVDMGTHVHYTHTQILSPFLTQGSLWPSWLLSGLPININEAMSPDSETHVLSGGGDGWQ